MAERWLPVVGYEDIYEVSNYGSVRRIKAYNQIVIKAQHFSHQGYLRVFLTDRNGVGRTMVTHKIVASAFIGPRPQGMTINHKNGNKIDNSATNLEYVTPSQNSQHAVDTGLIKPIVGEAHYACRITDSQVREIIARVAKGEPRADIAKEFGINIKTISDYVLGVRRKSVTRTTRIVALH